MRGVVLPVLAVLLATTSAVAASPFAGSFEQTGEAHMAGDATVEGIAHVIDVSLPAGSVVALEGDSVQRLDYSTERVEARLPLLRPVSAEDTSEPSVQDLGHKGPVTVSFSGPDPSIVRFIPDEPGMRLATQGTARISPPGTWAGLPSTFAMDHVQEFGDVDLHPSTNGALLDAQGNVTLDLGAGFLVVDGPWVAFAGQRIKTGHDADPGPTFADPVTGSGRQAYAGVLVMVHVSSLAIACEACQATAHWQDLHGTTAGQVRWHGVEGTNEVDDEPLPTDVELLEAGGTYAWDVTSRDSAMVWRVHGEAQWVKADAASVALGVAAAATGVALVALGALLVAWIKGIATFLLGRHTPRLVKAPLLDGDARYRILEAIHQVQPATLRRLQQATGLSRGNLRYHLRVLESHDVLQSVLPQGHKRRERSFMLNSGSLMFRSVGLSAPMGDAAPHPDASGRILSAVNADDVRAAILRLLLERGAMTFDQLQAALTESGVVATWPRSTASYQLKKMVSSGAIGERRQGVTKVYFAEIDPAEARTRQYASYFIQSGNQAIVEALAAGPKTAGEVEAILRRRGASAAGLKSRLEKLTGLALLQKDVEERFSLDPQVAGGGAT